MFKVDAGIAQSPSRKEKQGPRLVRSGKVVSANAFAEVLRLINGAKDIETGILHIRGSVLQGDIVIGGGTKILGASTSSGLSGWAAARALLCVSQGLFQFHDFSGTNIGSLNQDLEIRLLPVIDAMPELPANFADLNVRTSLNRMRAMDAEKIVEDRIAEQEVLKHVRREVQQFDDRTMRFRAAILWSFFVLMSLATITMHSLIH